VENRKPSEKLKMGYMPDSANQIAHDLAPGGEKSDGELYSGQRIEPSDSSAGMESHQAREGY